MLVRIHNPRVINIKIGMCKRGEVWDLINRYILATSLSQAKTWFPLTNVVVFHIFSDLRCEMVVLLILLTTTVETCSHKYKLQNSYRTKGCIYKWLLVYHWEIIYLIISPFYLYASRPWPQLSVKKTVVLMIDCLHTSMKLKKYHPDRKVPHTI
jgi:hypothetical protein